MAQGSKISACVEPRPLTQGGPRNGTFHEIWAMPPTAMALPRLNSGQAVFGNSRSTDWLVVRPHAVMGITGVHVALPIAIEHGTHGQNENRKMTKLPEVVETRCVRVTGVGKQSVVHEVVADPSVLMVRSFLLTTPVVWPMAAPTSRIAGSSRRRAMRMGTSRLEVGRRQRRLQCPHAPTACVRHKCHRRDAARSRPTVCARFL